MSVLLGIVVFAEEFSLVPEEGHLLFEEDPALRALEAGRVPLHVNGVEEKPVDDPEPAPAAHRVGGGGRRLTVGVASLAAATATMLGGGGGGRGRGTRAGWLIVLLMAADDSVAVGSSRHVVLPAGIRHSLAHPARLSLPAPPDALPENGTGQTIRICH